MNHKKRNKQRRQKKSTLYEEKDNKLLMNLTYFEHNM